LQSWRYYRKYQNAIFKVRRLPTDRRKPHTLTNRSSSTHQTRRVTRFIGPTRFKLSVTCVIVEAVKLCTLFVDLIANRIASVLSLYFTESEYVMSEVGKLNRGWFVVALLSTGIIDLAVTGFIRSKTRMYSSKSPKQELLLRQKLAASDA
jgi:hypothetical protein